MKCFFSLIDGLPFAFGGCNGSTEELVSLLRVWEEEKATPDPKMQKKWVWKVNFHELDPSMRKISLHNAEKCTIAGLGD